MSNKYKQRADEHPRPHADVPMSIFGELLFSGRYVLVGKFVHLWCQASWKKDPVICCDDIAWLAEGESLSACRILDLAVASGFIVERDGGMFLTGPGKDAAWLLNAQKPWRTYAIANHSRGAVKIGRSVDVERRISELQCASPERLLLMGTIDGDHEDRIHEALAAYRCSGEWFVMCAGAMEILRTEGLS